MKNALSSNVSDNAPLAVQTNNTMPAATPRMPESSDHQKPGACRIIKVVTKPTTPEIRNNQPMMSVNVIVASGGTKWR